MDDKHKSRRSSILKPAKPRNPLSDVDLNPHPPSASTEATFMKSRRVSFANSNFIKEFTADPEKNTIWHNSYEEEVNKSEDSKSIEQQANISTFEDDDEFNCTKVEMFDSSFETALVRPLETSICSANIDLPNPVFNLNDPEIREQELGAISLQRDRNICIHQYSSGLFDQNAIVNMEITGSIPANSNLMKSILKCKQQQLHLSVMNKENEPHCNDDDEMELTRAAHSNTLTPAVIVVVDEENSIVNIESVDAEDCSMEITQTVPTSITTDVFASAREMEMTRVLPGDIQCVSQTQSISDDMDFTQAISTSICTTSNDNMEMEFTQTIPSAIKLVTSDCFKRVSEKNDNMEFTQTIPSAIKFVTSDCFKRVSEKNDNMEFTQTIPSAIKLVTSDCFKRISEKNDNMEFTQPLPATINLIKTEAQTIPDTLKYLVSNNRKFQDEEYKLENTELTAENSAGESDTCALKLINNSSDKSDMVTSAEINVNTSCSCESKESEAVLTLGHLLSSGPSMGGNDCDANKSDICLRIKHSEPDAAASTLNVDSTEKLINYQIELNCERSSENICKSANINQDENVAWQSMIEKSFINNDILSSENVSLVNSFDVEDLKVEEPETKETMQSMLEKCFINNDILLSENVSLVNSFDVDNIKVEEPETKKTISDCIDMLEEALKMAENIGPVPYSLEDDDELKCAGVGVALRKRFEEAFKPQKKELSLEEKIREKSEDAIWNFVESNGLMYTFDFLYETIVFDVHVAEGSENVQKIQFYSQFDETDADPSILLTRNMLKKKLTKKYISSALGHPYDVLSLLNLISEMTGEMVDDLDELNELTLRYCLVIDADLKAQIQFLDLDLPVGFDVTININNFEHITSDDVHVNVLAGEIDCNAIKKLVNGCPMGINFLRKFIVNVEGYIEFLNSIE